jgi:hypothetical protein
LRELARRRAPARRCRFSPAPSRQARRQPASQPILHLRRPGVRLLHIVPPGHRPRVSRDAGSSCKGGAPNSSSDRVQAVILTSGGIRSPVARGGDRQPRATPGRRSGTAVSRRHVRRRVHGRRPRRGAGPGWRDASAPARLKSTGRIVVGELELAGHPHMVTPAPCAPAPSAPASRSSAGSGLCSATSECCGRTTPHGSRPHTSQARLTTPRHHCARARRPSHRRSGRPAGAPIDHAHAPARLVEQSSKYPGPRTCRSSPAGASSASGETPTSHAEASTGRLASRPSTGTHHRTWLTAHASAAWRRSACSTSGCAVGGSSCGQP